MFALIALLGAGAIGGGLLLRRRRVAGRISGDVFAIDRRHMGVAIAAAFVVGAAIAAAILAYLIVNPSAVG